jgi:NADPH-dependent curcumin reductase CurA
MPNRINRQWRLATRPEREAGPAEDHFRLEQAPVPEIANGQVLVRTVYLSLDPTQRLWMSEMDQYMEPVAVGDVMRGGTIGVVEESRADGVVPGDIVQGFWGWQDYAAVDAATLRAKLAADDDVPLVAYMAVLGAIGCTAYFGLLDIGRPEPGETVVITAAAGAVGSIVGQIAKIKGCRAVGIAGGPEKCAWIKDELGFDAAIDYRSEDVPVALSAHCPDGIDVVFENVGGDLLDASLALINLNARIALCGLIAQYNAAGPVPGPTMFHNILMKRARVEGFIILDYMDRFPEALAELRGWLREGRLKYRVDVVDGLDNAPQALGKLFVGANKGKLVVKVSDPPS